MEEVKEEVLIKPEIKEESIIPLIEAGADLENVISTVKKEDADLIEGLLNVAKEENHTVKIDSEAKQSILTSLVKSCSEGDVKNYKHNLEVKDSTDIQNNGEELSPSVTGVSREINSEEGMVEDFSPVIYELSRKKKYLKDKACSQNTGNMPSSHHAKVLSEQIEAEGDMDDERVDCIVSLESESLLEQMDDSNIDNNNQCNECEKTFECRDSLLDHVKNVHTKNKRPKHHCSVCGMEFKYKANCRKHEKLHEDLYHFKCRYCNISFKQSLTLKNHYIYVHENEKPYKCEDCDSSFKSLNNLKSHIEVHHNSSGETFPCDFCHMEFKRRCYLKRHLLIHTNPDKKFTCADCGLKCRSKTDIAKHVLTHIGVVEKNFFCEICGTGFSKQAHVTRHRRTHSFEKSFPCELCDRAYKDQYSLKTHHETVHLGITFSCEICGFQSDRHSLKKHLKRCEGQKKYTCEVCNKEYYLKKWFEQHTSKCHSKC